MRLHVIPDLFNKTTWFSEDVRHVGEFLTSYYDKGLPENICFYERMPCAETRIELNTKEDVDYLLSLDCDIFVVQQPALDPLTIAAIVSAVLSVATTVYVYLAMPKMKNAAAESPNNELSSRKNQARLNGRIPDIYGTVRSTPDMISISYTEYVDGIEKEESVMCVGRKSHVIHDCREGETDVEDISGSSASFYAPFKNIIGDDTIYRSGEVFNHPPIAVTKSSAINGQTLEEPNDTELEGTEFYFESPNIIKSRNTIDFTTSFAIGDSIEISGAVFGVADVSLSGNVTFKPDRTLQITSAENINLVNNFKGVQITGALVEVSTGVFKDLSGQYQVSNITKTANGSNWDYLISLVNAGTTNPNWVSLTVEKVASAGLLLNDNTETIDLDETYSVSTVSASQITLVNPAVVNSDWLKLAALPNQNTSNQTADIELDKVTSKWVGWHNIQKDDADTLQFNLYFPQGLYRTTSKGGLSHASLYIDYEYQQIDANNNPIGAISRGSEFYDETRRGSFGVTIKLPITLTGTGVRFRISKSRVRKMPNVVADVKIKEVYLTSVSNVLNYGNLTIARVIRVATDGALSYKASNLNCLVTKQVKEDGTGELIATNSAGQAIIDMALDEKIGRRSVTEVDVAQIIAEIDKAETYFGSPLATEFCYTLDDASLSFEESVGMVSSAAFCEAYRFGSKLRVRFESPQADSVLLFNGRNKELGSEKRTYSFGIDNDYDGITLEYTSNTDDSRINYMIPSDGSARNPLEIKTSGIRNPSQAMTRAWREWNKLYYKSTICEFTALYESEILARNDRILVADNTNTKTQDGHILSVDGLVLETSEPVEFLDGDYHVHLQLADGRTDVIPCEAGSNEYEIVLNRAPLVELVVDEGRRVVANYLLVSDNDATKTTFMVNTVDPASDNTNTVKCVNYTDKYYQNDHDFF